MSMNHPLDVFGIPLPSSAPLFLAAVAVHVVAGGAAVLAATAVFVSKKGTRFHVRWGGVYYGCLLAAFVTALLLAILRWPDDTVLAALGTLALLLASLGRRAKKWAGTHGTRWHAVGMSVSFVVMLTAFYVDNGKNLPVWRNFPPVVYWLAPTAVGLPLLLYSLMRNPLTRSRQSAKR